MSTYLFLAGNVIEFNTERFMELLNFRNGKWNLLNLFHIVFNNTYTWNIIIGIYSGDRKKTILNRLRSVRLRAI